MRKYKFFIGYLPAEGEVRVKFHIKEITERDEKKFVINMLKDIFGETEFLEFGKWYRAEELDGFIAIVENEYAGFDFIK